MQANRTLSNFLFSGIVVPSFLMNASMAVLRIGTGLSMALLHGFQKFPPSERLVAGLGEHGFPLPYFFAILAGLSELLGGLLLAVGFATRLAALSLSVTMGVALFVWHANDPWATKEKAAVYFLIVLLFFFVGSGRFGMDRVIKKKYSIQDN